MDLNNAAFIFTAYRKLLHFYTDFQMRSLCEYDLSPNEIVVLASLGEICTASEIACKADVSKALVSRSVKLLKQKCFISTAISESDKREQNLSLTDKGRAVADIIEKTSVIFFENSMEHFSTDEKMTLENLLIVMLKNLGIGGLNDDRRS